MNTSVAAAAPTAFIGGGNMASAIIGGLVEGGRPRESIIVVEPDAAQRERLQARCGVRVLAAAEASLAQAATIVWAVSRRALPPPPPPAARGWAMRCSCR